MAMILHQFPDLQWLKNQAEQRFQNRAGVNGRILADSGWPTVILNTVAKQTYRDNIKGPLSLFTNLSGQSNVHLEGKRTIVKEEFFFLSNPEQHYTLEINQPRATETFNIHFGEHLVDKVFESLTHSPEHLLENHFESPLKPIAFHNRLQPHDAVTKQLLLRIKHCGEDTLLLEETLYKLLTHLLRNEKDVKEQISKMPSIKSSTREELIQRLFHAKDYIYSFYDQPLSLEELAKASCLSKFHFLRLFKIAFQKTPHQFINEVRIQKAKVLLRETTLEIHDIARQTGFNNSSSFSRMFYNNVGGYPTQFR
jgi:AraC family transcriptional regulator